MSSKEASILESHRIIVLNSQSRQKKERERNRRIFFSFSFINLELTLGIICLPCCNTNN